MGILEDQLAGMVDRASGDYWDRNDPGFSSPAASKTITNSNINSDPTTQEVGSSSRLITNVPSLRDQASTFIESPKQPTQNIQNPANNSHQFVQDYQKRIMEAPTYEAKNTLMAEFRQAAEARIVAAHQAVSKVADNDMQVPQWRQRLNQAVELDKRNPELQGLDSELTAKIRAETQRREGEARKVTGELLKSNPQLSSFISTVEDTLKTGQAHAEKQWQLNVRNLDKEEAKKEAAAQLLAGTDPNVRETLVTKFPDLKDDVSMARFATQNPKEMLPILQGTIPPENYLKEGLAGNRAAKMMAVLEQAKRTGMDEKTVAGDVNYAQQLVDNPALLTKELQRYGLAQEAAMMKKMETSLIAGGQDAQKQAKLASIGLVDKVLFSRNKERIESNIENWPTIPGKPSILSTPEAATAYQTLKEATGKQPSLQAFASAYVGETGIPAEERIRRQQQIADSYSATMQKLGNGVLHVPYNEGYVKDRTREMMVRTGKSAVDSMAGRIGAAVKDSFSLNNPWNPLAMPGIAANAVLKPIVPTLDEFMNGLVNGGK